MEKENKYKIYYMSKLDLADTNESKSQGKNPKKEREARSTCILMQLNPYFALT